MEAVVDKIIAEIQEVIETPEFEEIMDVSSEVYWGDPMMVSSDDYPYFYVEPVSEGPESSTLGLAGSDRRRLEIVVGLVINSADYFDPSVSESPGLRPLVQAMALVSKRLRRLGKSGLDGEAGLVNKVVVGSTNFIPDVRNEVFVRMAAMTLAVDKTYQHEE